MASAGAARSPRHGRLRRAITLVTAALGVLGGIVGCGILDSGPQPPESLKQAATDPQWAAQQVAKLPPWSKGQQTQGLFFRPGKTAPPLGWASGEDGNARYANAILKGSKRFNPDGKPGPFDAARHAEVKAAGYMRKNSLSFAVLVINNTEGVCGGEDKPQGCTNAVPVVLPNGYRLIVWWPAGSEPQKATLDGQGDN